MCPLVLLGMQFTQHPALFHADAELFVFHGLCNAGSDDGTAHVWDVRSRQPVQIINAPSKVPVTSVLVLSQPQHLTPGGAAGAGGSGRQGPKRPQPLAPLVKYQGEGWERHSMGGAQCCCATADLSSCAVANIYIYRHMSFRWWLLLAARVRLQLTVAMAGRNVPEPECCDCCENSDTT